MAAHRSAVHPAAGWGAGPRLRDPPPGKPEPRQDPGWNTARYPPACHGQKKLLDSLRDGLAREANPGASTCLPGGGGRLWFECNAVPSPGRPARARRQLQVRSDDAGTQFWFSLAVETSLWAGPASEPGAQGEAGGPSPPAPSGGALKDARERESSGVDKALQAQSQTPKSPRPQQYGRSSRWHSRPVRLK